MTTLATTRPEAGSAPYLWLKQWAIAVPLVLPLLLFALLVLNPSLNAEIAVPVQHFFVVIPVTATAVILASGVLKTALRLRHAPTFYLGIAYLSIAGIFLVHGISTPGVFRAVNDLVALSAWLSLLVGGLFLALSIWGEDAPFGGWVTAHMPRLMLAILTALAAYGIIGVALTAPAAPAAPAAPPITAATAGDINRQGASAPHPNHPAGTSGYDAYADYGYGYDSAPAASSTSPTAPAEQSSSNRAPASVTPPAADHVHLPPLGAPQAMLLIVGLCLYGAATYGYWRRYLMTELPLVGALAVSSALLFDAQVSMYLGTPWRLNWWLYHVLMLTGFSIGAGAVLWESYKGRKLHRVIEGMYTLRNDVQLELEYSDVIAVVAAATEVKDSGTQGHVLRVAQLSSRLGRELGLSPTRLRVLARAGLLHDVGKLQIPDAILKKPGALTDEEFEVMKRHPLLGHSMLRSIGQLEEEIAILVAHHERMDGTGYPYGSAGNKIPFEARILSVADFFDALTADRPYRKALPWDVAMDITKRESGTHLDPECVQALFHLIETDPLSMQDALTIQPKQSEVPVTALHIPELSPKAHY